MKGLREKLQRHGGFTLVEMLIVVAIIAILVAISIPMVSSSLEKAREAVDQANLRDAIALGNIQYLSGEIDASTVEQTRYYHVDSKTHQGNLTETKDEATPAECTCTSANGVCGSAAGHIIEVTISTDGKISAEWVAKT